MVSTKVMTEIRRGYELLAKQSIDIHKYSGRPLFDIVFEIITADTFIAGIASKLLDRDAITSKERNVLSAPLLVEGRLWRCNDGQLFDVQPYSEIHEVATSIESLRAKCNDALSSTDSPDRG